MKIRLVLLFFIFSFYTSFAQQWPIEYKNGNDKFIVFLYRNLLAKQIDPTFNSNSRYFNIIMNFDRTGKLIETTVLSIDDTLMGKAFIKIIRQTQGNWINHTDSNQTLVLPVYWEYENNKGLVHKTINTFRTDRDVNGKLGRMTFLKPLEIKFF